MFVDLSSLPKYTLCTVEELLSAQDEHQGTVTSPLSPETMTRCPDEEKGRYAFNGRGRVLLVTKDDREVAVVAVKRPIVIEEGKNDVVLEPFAVRLDAVAGGGVADVYAFDKNCFHVGYPLDLGDIEDIDVQRCDSGANFHVTCITCPLHNRIFDLRTGGLVTVSHDPASTSTATCLVHSGKRKGGAPSVVPCHQRVHPVTINRESSSSHRIVVHDTFGFSNASTQPSTGVVFQKDVPLLSDKYNAAGAVEEFHEFDPKRGNSFVRFRKPSESKKSSTDQTAAAATTCSSADVPRGERPVVSSSENEAPPKARNPNCCTVS